VDQERLNPNNDSRESTISKVVGVDATTEQELLDYFKRKFEAEEKSFKEKEHSQELDDLISRLNAQMKEFLGRYGVSAIEVPAKNIHIPDQSAMNSEQLAIFGEKFKGIAAQYFLTKQRIIVVEDYRKGNKLNFLQGLSHEMFHLNSFHSVQRTDRQDVVDFQLVAKSEDGETENISLIGRRAGFSIVSRDADAAYFRDIDEAIMTELEMRFDQEYLSKIPELEEEYQAREEAITALGARTGEDIESLRKTVAALSEIPQEDGGANVRIMEYSYKNERKQLNELIDNLYEKNQSEFSSREDVFKLFVEAAMSGRLLPIARLIEKTCGKGSFRELGEMTAKRAEDTKPKNNDLNN
jgi:hypothetical protein